MEFHGTRVIWHGGTLVPWNSMELLLYSIWRFQNSLKSYMKYEELQWNLMSFKLTIRQICYHHGITWNFVSLQVRWNFHSSMGFHGKCHHGLVMEPSSKELLKFHGIPWNLPHGLEMFHGITWNSIALLASSIEFHGIPRNCKISIFMNFIIREVYFIVCCIISLFSLNGDIPF